MMTSEVVEQTQGSDFNLAETENGSSATEYSNNVNIAFGNDLKKIRRDILEKCRGAEESSPAEPLNEDYDAKIFSNPVQQGLKSKHREASEVIVQDWEGIVESIETEIFTALLRDLTANEAYPGERADLPIEDITPDDRGLLKPGAIFYLTIGRSTGPTGQQQRFSRMEFRRLPVWTSADFDRADERAQRLAHFLGSES